MCLGIPGLVVERSSDLDELAHGTVEFAGIRRDVSLAFVPEAIPGDYVIVHAGVAISRVDPAEAERVFDLLKAIGDSEDWTQGGWDEVPR